MDKPGDYLPDSVAPPAKRAARQQCTHSAQGFIPSRGREGVLFCLDCGEALPDPTIPARPTVAEIACVQVVTAAWDEAVNGPRPHRPGCVCVACEARDRLLAEIRERQRRYDRTNPRAPLYQRPSNAGQAAADRRALLHMVDELRRGAR